MADSNREEIAKLEALYANNPEGRVFTHLAEAYRKAGELDRARAILQEGLTRHPAYASAHVVLGRVLADQQNTEEAAEEFRRVLDLDPHNHVALRCLGDMARSAGQRDEALSYFRELRQLDPNNDELGRVIEELSAAPDVAVMEESLPESVAEAETPASAEAEEAPTAPPEFAAAASGAKADDVDTEEDLGQDLEFDWVPSPEDEETESGLPGDLGELAALGTQEISAELPTYEEPAQPEEFGNIDLSVPEEGPLQPEAELDSFSLADSAAPPVAPAEVPEPVEPVGAKAAEPEQTGEVLTPTIAELYSAQGLHDRAAEVYRALIAQRPDDSALREKLAEAEALARAPRAEVPPSGPAPVETAVSPGWETDPWATAPVSATPEPEPSVPPFEPTEALEQPLAAQGPGEEAEAWIAGSAALPESAPTPYAWTEAQKSEPDGGPPISDYFSRLLSWKPSSPKNAAPAGDVGVAPPPVATDNVAPSLEIEPEPEPMLFLEEQTIEEQDFPAQPAQPEEGDPWLHAPSSAEPDPWQELPPDEPAAPPAAAPPPARPPVQPAPPVEHLDAGTAFDEWFDAAAPPGEVPPPAQQPPSPVSDEESSGEDDDLEMFRSWLQSLKK